MLTWGCRRAPPRGPGHRSDTRTRRHTYERELASCSKNLPRRPTLSDGEGRDGSATVAAVRPPAGAAARSKLADQRGLCCRTRLAERKAPAVSAASPGRLRVRASWDLPAAHADGDADHPVPLPAPPTRPSASCPIVWRVASRGSRRHRTRGRARRRGAQHRSRRRRPAAGHRAALGGAVGAAAPDAGPSRTLLAVVTLLPDLFTGDRASGGRPRRAGTPTTRWSRCGRAPRRCCRPSRAARIPSPRRRRAARAGPRPPTRDGGRPRAAVRLRIPPPAIAGKEDRCLIAQLDLPVASPSHDEPSRCFATA